MRKVQKVEMIQSRKVSDKLYVIPWNDNYILYLPLNGLAFLGDKQTLFAILRLEQGSADLPGQRDEHLRQFLEKANCFSEEQVLFSKDIDTDTDFAPTRVGISTTTDCNLRCVYCYSNAGKEKQVIQWGAVKTSIDVVAENARKKKIKGFEVGFFGGGEPTQAWKVMEDAVGYAREVAGKKGLEVFLNTGTNAMVSKPKAVWLAKNFDLIEISWDGPQGIQDIHRPRKAGNGSFDKVYQTIKTIEDCGGNYRLRSTISDYSAPQMEKIVTFVHNYLNPLSLQFEPLMPTGRGGNSTVTSPSASIFASQFVRALKRAREWGITLFSTVAQIGHVSSYFCGVQSRNFLITPYGQVTLCPEVTNPDLPESDVFFYGYFDSKNEEFVFDLKKMRKMSLRKVDKISRCANCFCKWSCSGGCTHAIDYGHDPEKLMYRCLVTRATTKAILEDLFCCGRRLVSLPIQRR